MVWICGPNFNVFGCGLIEGIGSVCYKPSQHSCNDWVPGRISLPSGIHPDKSAFYQDIFSRLVATHHGFKFYWRRAVSHRYPRPALSSFLASGNLFRQSWGDRRRSLWSVFLAASIFRHFVAGILGLGFADFGIRRWPSTLLSTWYTSANCGPWAQRACTVDDVRRSAAPTSSSLLWLFGRRSISAGPCCRSSPSK